MKYSPTQSQVSSISVLETPENLIMSSGLGSQGTGYHSKMVPLLWLIHLLSLALFVHILILNSILTFNDVCFIFLLLYLYCFI